MTANQVERRSRRAALTFIRLVAKEYKVPVRLSRKVTGQRAEINPFEKNTPITIFVRGNTGDQMVKSFFHELAHAHCIRNNIYPAFHGKKGWTKFMKASVLHGLQAERYVDRLGKEMLKMWVPIGTIGRWEKAYNNKEAVFHYKFYLALPRYMALVEKGVFGRKAA